MLIYLKVFMLLHVSCVFVHMFESSPRSDLPIFATALEKITDFVLYNPDKVDINLMLGVFISKVNLEQALTGASNLPPEMTKLLQQILGDLGDILKDFHSTQAELPITTEKKITTLYTNSALWSRPLPVYTRNLLTVAHVKWSYPTAKSSKPAAIYKGGGTKQTMNWNAYREMVLDYDSWVPNPSTSADCFAELSALPEPDSVEKFINLPACPLSEVCRDVFVQGTGFGYALTHRILLLLTALLSRNCLVSPLAATDALLLHTLCVRVHNETEYIFRHLHSDEPPYLMRDLFMEQISLCSLLGKIEFLHRPWILNIISWQTSSGCYALNNTITPNQHSSTSRTNVSHKRRYKRSDDGDYLEADAKEVEEASDASENKEECENHSTSVAMAALSVALKFVVQNYYYDK